MRNYNSSGLRLITAPFNSSDNGYGNNRYTAISIWTGPEFSDAEFDALAAASFTNSYSNKGYAGSTYSGYIQSTLGRTLLLRYLFDNNSVPRRIITDFNTRLFSFSQASLNSLGLADGNAGCFTLSLVNDTTDQGYSNATTANRIHPFIVNGSVGDLNSSADLRMRTTAITVGQKVRMNDMLFKIGDALNIPLF